jgi:hypothetical protein
MGTGKQPISSAVQPAGRVVQVELALGPVLAELGTARVLALEPEIGPVVGRELATDLEAELEPEIDRVVGRELATDLAAELGIDPPHGHLAVLAKTKSVTAVHRRGLVPLLAAEEDLGAAAETMREQVAAEAVTAWAAADIAAVEVVVAE